MRFINALKNDVRFQIKYGFYFLYAFFSAVYIAVLVVTPPVYQKIVSSLIVLSDPAMLGVFFVGGIWLLEKGEGLHLFWCVSPLRPIEYVLSKSVSLAVLSTISAVLIAAVSMRGAVRLALLAFSVFGGAVVFNIAGLTVASYARSVNHYMLIVTLPAVFLSIPPILTALGFTHPALELFPGTALWHMIASSIDPEKSASPGTFVVLLLWFGTLLWIAKIRIGTALQSEGGNGE